MNPVVALMLKYRSNLKGLEKSEKSDPDHTVLLTWMTALNQHVFPTLRMPTGQSSWRIQSAGLLMSVWPSLLFTLLIRTRFSSALASKTLELITSNTRLHQSAPNINCAPNVGYNQSDVTTTSQPITDVQFWLIVPVEVFLLLLSIVGILQAELNRCLQLVFRKSYESSLLCLFTYRQSWFVLGTSPLPELTFLLRCYYFWVQKREKNSENKAVTLSEWFCPCFTFLALPGLRVFRLLWISWILNFWRLAGQQPYSKSHVPLTGLRVKVKNIIYHLYLKLSKKIEPSPFSGLHELVWTPVLL